MVNRPSVTPANRKSYDRGDLPLTKRFYGFNSQLLLGLVIPTTLNMGVVPACIVLRMK